MKDIFDSILLALFIIGCVLMTTGVGVLNVYFMYLLIADFNFTYLVVLLALSAYGITAQLTGWRGTFRYINRELYDDYWDGSMIKLKVLVHIVFFSSILMAYLIPLALFVRKLSQRNMSVHKVTFNEDVDATGIISNLPDNSYLICDHDVGDTYIFVFRNKSHATECILLIGDKIDEINECKFS